MPKRPDVLLELALIALRRVPRFLERRSLSQYLADELCQSAIERQLEIAGDALGQIRKVDPALFARVPDGDLIVEFRNVLAHGYVTLDHQRVYDIAANRVAALEAVLEWLLEEMPEEGASS
ncbi:MAG: HepT-like ribonuclease domain-containing protein [Steroidobacteraceae bacterium]